MQNASGMMRAPRRGVTQPGQHSRVRRGLVVRVRAYKEERMHDAPAASEGGFRNQLEALRSMSTVVADTGEPALVEKYKPIDCTTNPSLVYKAMQHPDYQHHLAQALAQDKAERLVTPAAVLDATRPFAGVADRLTVNLGAEMLRHVPGRVSTEVDAHLSHDTRASVDKALRIVELYGRKGIDPSRLYIKLASTWEGIQACRELQRRGIDTNMTLIFSFAQAAACADAGAALISPFVGRIMDWYRARYSRDYSPVEDPGVLSVKRIYSYYKTHGYSTIVMAASFRNVGEIRELAGCDNITIAPPLLAELESCTEPLPRKLWPSMRDSSDPVVTHFSQERFRELHEADEMAVDKLAQGIENFAADQRLLEAQLAKLAGGGLHAH